MKKLIILVTLVIIAQTIQSARAEEVFNGRIIKHLQSNLIEGKRLGIFTDEYDAYPLQLETLPQNIFQSLKFLTEEKIQIHGELIEPENEFDLSLNLKISRIKIINDSEVRDLLKMSGLLKRSNSEKYRYSFQTNDETYLFNPKSKAIDRALINYIDQVIQISGVDDEGSNYDSSDECYWDDEYDEYVNEWGDSCDPDEYKNNDDEDEEEGDSFSLQGIELPTKYGKVTGKISRKWGSGSYEYFLVDPTIVIDDLTDEDEIPKIKIWVGENYEENFSNDFNNKVVTVYGPYLRHNRQEMLHAQEIQLAE